METKYQIIQSLVTKSGWRDYSMVHSTYASKAEANEIAAQMNANCAAYGSELHFTVQ